MSDDFSVSSARHAARQGQLFEWIADFLASPGSDNGDLAEKLGDEMQHWIGPVQLPLDDLHRLAGPPGEPALGRLGDDDLDTVEDMEDSIDDGWRPPPLIVTHRDGQLVLEDGTHRIEGLRRAGRDEYWCLVGFADAESRDRFTESGQGAREG